MERSGSLMLVKDEKAELCVGRLPGRKRAALYCVRDNTVVPLAYFVSDEAEAEFWRIMGEEPAAARGALDESEGQDG